MSTRTRTRSPTLWGNAIFTNVALTDDGDVWWEGLTEQLAGSPHRLEGPRLDARVGRAGCPPQRAVLRARGAVPHDRSRVGRTRPESRSRRSFGGRRASAVPLVTESCPGSTASSSAPTSHPEKTAAAEGTVGELRRDPFAMLPFCGYNMGDYIGHWLSIGRSTDADKLPRLYYVNWFRKDEDGAFLWPGFGENSRVLEWIVGRLDGIADAQDTAIGRLPTKAAFDIEGLDIDDRAFDVLLSVDVDVWRQEAALIPDFLRTFGDRMPTEIWDEHAALLARLDAAS